MKERKQVRIDAKDPRNYPPIFVEFSGDAVLIQSSAFDEPDPYKMIVISRDQLRKLQSLKIPRKAKNGTP